jgi:hypothetical protein
MDSRKVVMRETAAMAVGEILLSAAMVGVFAALGYFKMNVLWGALFGCLVMIVNHLFLAITVSMATDRAAKGNVQQAQKMIQLSSSTRLVLLGVVLVVCLKLGANPLALLLPLLFARPILMLWELFGKKEDK